MSEPNCGCRIGGGEWIPGGEAWPRIIQCPLCKAAPAMLKALIGVVRVADLKTDEFNAAREAIVAAKGRTQ